jgi:hypothetical protein
MSNLNRRPSIDASYQIPVHLLSGFRRGCLEIDQPETRIAYGGHICKRISTCQMPSDGKSSHVGIRKKTGSI